LSRFSVSVPCPGRRVGVRVWLSVRVASLFATDSTPLLEKRAFVASVHELRSSSVTVTNDEPETAQRGYTEGVTCTCRHRRFLIVRQV
jgi:predicted phage gp36 major capsid-like protein